MDFWCTRSIFGGGAQTDCPLSTPWCPASVPGLWRCKSPLSGSKEVSDEHSQPTRRVRSRQRTQLGALAAVAGCGSRAAARQSGEAPWRMATALSLRAAKDQPRASNSRDRLSASGASAWRPRQDDPPQAQDTGKDVPDHGPGQSRSWPRFEARRAARAGMAWLHARRHGDGGRLRVCQESLTKVARKITGAHWSGPRFFGLVRAGASSEKGTGDA
jgi:hypothetical protein